MVQTSRKRLGILKNESWRAQTKVYAAKQRSLWEKFSKSAEENFHDLLTVTST